MSLIEPNRQRGRKIAKGVDPGCTGMFLVAVRFTDDDMTAINAFADKGDRSFASAVRILVREGLAYRELSRR